MGYIENLMFECWNYLMSEQFDHQLAMRHINEITITSYSIGNSR